ncbi:hypothetical protein ONE63_005864 [Megalurothrips usitatus]|uniref:Uncharacterized protein n=1 Tax=Megalurothrips usitatus TaxID=439358 RepID=A0AAV7XXJ5_9NEOP|nr:hypothetical protein ONE63_005864 [Megalurothrips usitatus]
MEAAAAPGRGLWGRGVACGVASAVLVAAALGDYATRCRRPGLRAPGSGRANAAALLPPLTPVPAALLPPGVLLAHHLSPCNPRNVGRCGRRLVSSLQGLDADGRLGPQEEAAVLCPALTEALDCYYWFSQRCLPARDHHFYAKAYVDSSAAVDGLCRSRAANAAAAVLVVHGLCLRGARGRRWLCSERFGARLGHPGSGSGNAVGATESLVDSLYDPDAAGKFRPPLCRAIREFILCGLRLVSDHCGLHVALRLQDLQDNLTSLVFSDKCEADLRPVLELAQDPRPAPGARLPTSALPALICATLLALLSSAVLIRILKWSPR